MPCTWCDLKTLCTLYSCLKFVFSLLFSQFINDKFQYNHQVAMEMLIKCGLKDQVFELAKVPVIPIISEN